jgi:hypothetical protein
MANLRTNNLSGEQGQNAYRGSVFFDGTGDKLSVPNSADVRLGSNDFTVEAWVKFGNVTGSWDAIIGMWDHTQTRRTFNFQRYNTDGELYLYVSTDGGNSNWAYANGGNLTVNHWHHVAGVRDGNTLRVYQNGVQVGTASYSDSILNNTTDALFIGDVQTSDTNNMNGFISNVRLINGTCIYPNGTTFTPPKHELTLVPNTVLLACQNSDDVTQEATGKTITAAGGQLVNAAYVRQQPKVIPPYGVDAGNTFGGPIQQSSQGYMYFPTGRTEERGRGRGVYGGGGISTPTNPAIISFIDVQSQGNTTTFGSLTTENRVWIHGFGSSTRAIWSGGGNTGGSNTANTIDFVTIATTSNATDFGDATVAALARASLSNDTRGLSACGYISPANINTIDFVNVANLGNATDFGDATVARRGVARMGSSTRGIFAGGMTPSASDVMDFVTIATTGNATDFGNLVVAGRHDSGGCSSGTRGVIAGGNTSPGPDVNTIQFVTIASAGNASDFGDLQQTMEACGSLDNSIRGVFSGSYTPSLNTMNFITIATTGNALDFGDNTHANYAAGGTSDSHGGLS